MSEQLPDLPLMETVSTRVQIDCSGNSKTEQSHKKTADVNNIMRKFKQTGLMPQKMSTGQYGDFTSVSDYHQAVTLLQEAHSDFMALPAQLRKRFNNNPAELLRLFLDLHRLLHPHQRS